MRPQLFTAAAALCLLGSVSAATSASSASAAQASEEAAALQAIAKAVPACALECLAYYVPLSGCNITDTECICTNTELTDSLAGCLGANCTTVEALEATKFQMDTCQAPVRSRQGETKRVALSLWAVCLVVVAARFATRSEKFGGVGLGWDDWSILVVLGILTAITWVAYAMIDEGLGKDIWEVQPQNITNVLRYFWIEEILYCFCVYLTKLSIILFYLRIFSDQVSTYFRRICLFMLGVMIALPTAYAFATAFACKPVSYSWLRWNAQESGTCINTMAEIYSGSGTNTFFDLVVFVLPIPRLMTVQISTRRKIGICMTFLVGLFVTLCSITRLVYLIRWRSTTNPTWTSSPIALWSLIECNVGVFCACMPALAGPIKRFWTATIGKQISSLYGSRAKEIDEYATKKTGGSQGTSSKLSKTNWTMRSRNDDGRKPGETSIMCNVSLNVSDEVELVDKPRKMMEAEGRGGWDEHGYRNKW